MSKPRFPSFSVVIETENLALAGPNSVISTLNCLARQTLHIGTANEVFIVTSGKTSEKLEAEIKLLFPWTTVLSCENCLEYTQSKIIGAKATTGDIILFIDSDVEVEETWLENILGVFHSNSVVDLVTGNTTRCKGNNIISTALEVSWIFTIKRDVGSPIVADYFQLNSFAMRRFMLPFCKDVSHMPFYRGKKIGVFKNNLLKNGTLYKVHGARAFHATPQTLLDYILRLMVMGYDMISVGDYKFLDDKIIMKRSILKRAFRFPYVIFRILLDLSSNIYNHTLNNKNNEKKLLLLIGASPLVIANTGLKILGAIITVFHSDLIYKSILKREGEQ